MPHATYDYAIVGAGIGGLASATLLAARGHKVYLTEKHSVPGGYGQSFQMTRKGNRYLFCAQLHYLWHCLPGQEGAQFFKQTGLDRKVSFVPLAQDGFDVIRAPGISYRCKIGFENNIEDLEKLFPGTAGKLKQYFRIIASIGREVETLPLGATLTAVLSHPLKYRHVIRYHKWTVQKLLDEFNFPPKLQLILTAQIGNLMIPTDRASLLAFAGMIYGYYTSACVPGVTYKEVFESMVEFIRSKPGCKVDFSNEMLKFEANHGKIDSMQTDKSGEIRANRYIFNGDPKLLQRFIPKEALSRQFKSKLNYAYSPGSFSVFLGLKNIDLTKFGFGNWNFWHYTEDSFQEAYRKQYLAHDYSAPSFFLSTPNLHYDHGDKITPLGGQQMVCVTLCNYEYWKNLKQKGRSIYVAAKNAFAEKIYDQLDKHYIPGFRNYIDLAITGSPLTNERFVNTPFGNSYGADLSNENWSFRKISYKTDFSNLFLIGATAGLPSFAGGLVASQRLINILSPQKLTVSSALRQLEQAESLA